MLLEREPLNQTAARTDPKAPGLAGREDLRIKAAGRRVGNRTAQKVRRKEPSPRNQLDRKSNASTQGRTGTGNRAHLPSQDSERTTAGESRLLPFFRARDRAVYFPALWAALLSIKNRTRCPCPMPRLLESGSRPAHIGYHPYDIFIGSTSIRSMTSLSILKPARRAAIF